MKRNQLKLFALTLATGYFLAACSGGSQEKSNTADEEFAAAKQQMAAAVKQVLADIPPPSEVPLLLMQTGADFDQSLINTISGEGMAKYQKSDAKAALNLGVYATDIGYLISYGESESALDYMGECQKLAAPVGVAEAIDYGMIQKFEANLENTDSLASIIDQIMDLSGERLSQLDEMNSAALLLAGSWVEGIYLSTQIVDKYPDDLPEEARTLILEPLVRIVIDQKTSLATLLEAMDQVSDDAEVAQMAVELQKIQAIYEDELADVETSIAENTGDYVLLPSTLNSLAMAVATLRTSIIE
ncbi:MAG: hypothetical protein AAF616_00945 [Bacteroidota bacterium]